MKYLGPQTIVGTPKVKGRDNAAYTVPENDLHLFGWIIDANGASEAIKASRKSNLIFEQCTITCGVEDGADFVGCTTIKFIDCTFIRRNNPQEITWKGGSVTLEVARCAGMRRIVAGDYTIYDRWHPGPKSGDVTVSKSGTPRVELRWAHGAAGECRPLQWPEPLAWTYFMVRSCWPERGANAALVR